ncbi:alkaline phosphatase D family protein [Rhodococcus sp. NPDC058505]|uniref:alkaline phosphatase D family protein n=1 Tax=unclassified Rhodococcus (in: high G+C Gram-positive bacteria) TaxID=192944 RepID=UPI00364642A4
MSTDDSPRLTRRTVLLGSTLAAGAAVLAARTATATEPGTAFANGVASGDPLPDRVIIWTRITPTPDATPGSGAGAPTRVRWEVATDPGFAAVVRAGAVTATADTDHTVKVDVTGLAPATTYHYRFTAPDGQRSRPGRTRTAPHVDADVARLRFGVVSCSNWEAGYFAAYRHLAARDDLDAIVHLGDYLYEYGRGEYGARGGPVRLHDPAHEIVTLADYRIRHAQYKTDPDLQALHARQPFIVTWDDHETADNAWRDGAENHTPGLEGAWARRYADGRRAYLEWMPLRVTRPDQPLYRRLRFGRLAELSMLDLRSHRSEQVSAASAAVDATDRTITGARQLDWLTAGIVTAPTRWRLVGNPVMIAPILLPPLDVRTTEALTRAVGVPRAGLSYNADQWDGYTSDRRRLFDAIAAAAAPNTVFLTGDIHSSWAAELPLDAAQQPAGGTVGTEFVVPSVTSPNIDDLLGVPSRSASPAVEAALRATNRHLRHVELDSHGFGVFEVTADRAQMDWWYLTDPTDPAAGARVGASLAVADGSQRLSPATPLP